MEKRDTIEFHSAARQQVGRRTLRIFTSLSLSLSLSLPFSLSSTRTFDKRISVNVCIEGLEEACYWASSTPIFIGVSRKYQSRLFLALHCAPSARARFVDVYSTMAERWFRGFVCGEIRRWEQLSRDAWRLFVSIGDLVKFEIERSLRHEL